MDGGIRRGGDIAKAIAMGATAVLVGRAYAYGLAGAGLQGVSRAIEILRADLGAEPWACWVVPPSRSSRGNM